MLHAAHTWFAACRSSFFTASLHAQCRRTRARMKTRQCCCPAVTSSAGCDILVHKLLRRTTMMQFLSCRSVCRAGVSLEDRQEPDTQLQVPLLPTGDHSVGVQKDTLPSAHIGLTLPQRQLLCCQRSQRMSASMLYVCTAPHHATLSETCRLAWHCTLTCEDQFILGARNTRRRQSEHNR